MTTRSVNSLHKLSGIFMQRCCALSAAMSSKPNWSRMVATSSQWRSCTSFLSIVYHAPSVALSLFSGRPCSFASAASRAMAARRRETYGQGYG